LAKPGYTGLKRILHATKFSMQGFAQAWRYESAFRQELTLTLLLAPLAFWLGRTGVERLLLIGSCLLVLIVELLNSAVEAAIDRVGEEQHELSGRAKDFGSAAVLISLVMALGIWLTIGWLRFTT
jgi:diacylglycerol kinase (ATP)